MDSSIGQYNKNSTRGTSPRCFASVYIIIMVKLREYFLKFMGKNEKLNDKLLLMQKLTKLCP